MRAGTPPASPSVSTAAAATFVLASSEKLGTASRYAVLPLQDVAGLVTDVAPEDPTVAALVARGVRVLHATD